MSLAISSYRAVTLPATASTSSLLAASGITPGAAGSARGAAWGLSGLRMEGTKCECRLGGGLLVMR